MGEIGYSIHVSAGKIVSVATRWPDNVKHVAVPVGTGCMICGEPRANGEPFPIVPDVGEVCPLCHEVMTEVTLAAAARQLLLPQSTVEQQVSGSFLDGGPAGRLTPEICPHSDSAVGGTGGTSSEGENAEPESAE